MKRLSILLLLLLLLTGCKSGNGVSLLQPSEHLSASTQEETIRIQPEELLLSVGETASLVCQNASEQAVTDVEWSVADERIATITNDGTVTAVAKGKTTATAKRKGPTGTQVNCHIIVEEQKMLATDGVKIEINDKVENVIAQDGTNCTMTFEMQADSTNGVFKGQAMLQSIGVKDAKGSVPAAGMLELVSKAEFTLEPSAAEKESADNEIELAPLAKLDYRVNGTFLFIMTDVGFLAL